MNKLHDYFFRFWRPVLAIAVIALLSYVLFFHNLAHLLPGYSPHEVATFKAATNGQTILDHPLNAPHKLVIYALNALGHHSILITRIASALFAVVACLLFFVVTRYWFNYRVALLATVLFATASGFLHIARLGTSAIMQTAILAMLATGIWWQESSLKGRTLIGIFGVGLFAVMLYIPGMIWFEVVVLVILRHSIRRTYEAANWQLRALAAFMVLLLLTPLVRAIVLSPAILLTFLGLPVHFAAPLQILENILNAILLVGVHSNGKAELWLAHAPLLNIAEIVLLALGAFAFLKHTSTSRVIIVFSAIAISLLLIGLSGDGSNTTAFGSQFSATGPMNTSSLLPLLYLLIAGGIYELISQWFTVFPRNPFARILGVFCIVALVSFSALYQYRAYFVAWPNNSATKQTFSIHQ